MAEFYETQVTLVQADSLLTTGDDTSCVFTINRLYSFGLVDSVERKEKGRDQKARRGRRWPWLVYSILCVRLPGPHRPCAHVRGPSYPERTWVASRTHASRSVGAQVSLRRPDCLYHQAEGWEEPPSSIAPLPFRYHLLRLPSPHLPPSFATLPPSAVRPRCSRTGPSSDHAFKSTRSDTIDCTARRTKCTKKSLKLDIQSYLQSTTRPEAAQRANSLRQRWPSWGAKEMDLLM